MFRRARIAAASGVAALALAGANLGLFAAGAYASGPGWTVTPINQSGTAICSEVGLHNDTFGFSWHEIGVQGQRGGPEPAPVYGYERGIETFSATINGQVVQKTFPVNATSIYTSGAIVAWSGTLVSAKYLGESGGTPILQVNWTPNAKSAYFYPSVGPMAHSATYIPPGVASALTESVCDALAFG